jgi:hypothetical protein
VTTLKDVLHTLADKVRHADEEARAALHRDIDELADYVEHGADVVDPPAAGDQVDTAAAGAGATKQPAKS